MWKRAVAEEVGIVGGDARVGELGVVGVGKGDVAAEGEGAEGELDARRGEESGKRGAEADSKFGDADAEKGGGKEVAGFVDDYDGGEDSGGFGDGLQNREVCSREGRETPAAGGGEEEGVGRGKGDGFEEG
ncbi:hypothetical protein IEQ34_026691 [Dendrobium chrysotoxum]|uniref:Uncharacterized protein n=1 Tax=Dendrobium chrysotoxum TaxID=161865 RepID=A0AAV7FLG3_DENCH|nr:hypothetical protein IEQ34_026691 [Dendrobium chrysotoxum]